MPTTRWILSLFALFALLPAGGVPAQVCELLELDTATAGGSLSQPALYWNTAYVAAGSDGIARFDISRPSQLALLDVLPTEGQAFDLVLDFFNARLIVADGTAGVGLYDVDNGGSVGTGTVNLGQTIISIAGDETRFLAGSQEGTVYTLTVGSGSIEVQGSVETGGQARDLVQQSRFAYCALGNRGLAVVDISDRTNPVVVETTNLGGAVLSVTYHGGLLFCGVDGIGVVVVEVEDGSMATVGALALDGTPTGIIYWGGRLYMTGPEIGVVLGDASLGSDLLLLSELELDGASALALAGSMLYVGRGTMGLSTVDSSDCSTNGVLATVRYIPAAARSTGAVDTFWVTDVAIANLTDDVAVYNMAYLVKGQGNASPANVSATLGPGQQLLVEDVFDTLFELGSANGALRITTSHPDVKITSRTYNAAGAQGTYGQFIPAQVWSDALQPGLLGSLLQLQENAVFRTNIGLLNLTLVEVEVEIELYRASGNLVGVLNETLLANEMEQVNRVFMAVGAGTVDSGYAVVKVQTQDGAVLAYASVVDGDSGDPIFVPAQQLTVGTPFDGD